jgi:ABC-type phosphate transport system substrate-binding protein
MAMRVRRLMVAIVFLLAATSHGEEPVAASVSVLVSAKNPMRDISTGDLRRIFLGDISRWHNGHRIVLFVRPMDTSEGRLFLDHLMRMSDIDYSQWWLGAVFRGRVASAPRVIGSAEEMFRAVAVTPDAIGFVAAQPSAEAGVVVLTVDGKAPADPRYALRAR